MEQCNELYHHGIKGQRWGFRRFQTKDGALTKAGQKRYNKEIDKLKAEKKELRNKERTKKKLAKLNDLKKDVDKLEKDVKDEETLEQKRERLLKSTDAKELYENRNLLTTSELSERINRIDTEARLQSKIVEEKKKSGMDYVNDKMRSTANTINNVSNLYKSIDNAYSSVANSTVGKILENQLGVELPKGQKPKRQFNKEDFDKLWENRKQLKDDEMRDFVNALNNEVKAKQSMDKLNGKDTGGKGKGMSRQEVEDLINDILDEKDLNHSAIESDELFHYGNKGMKWGVHRFYNKDGTRTAAGKKRENEAKRGKNQNEDKKPNFSNKEEVNTYFKKKFEELSEEEGRVRKESDKAYERFRNKGEQKYADLGKKLIEKSSKLNLDLDTLEADWKHELDKLSE